MTWKWSCPFWGNFVGGPGLDSSVHVLFSGLGATGGTSHDSFFDACDVTGGSSHDKGDPLTGTMHQLGCDIGCANSMKCRNLIID